MKRSLFLLEISLFMLLSSCYTVSVQLTPDSPKELYFKKAQELAAYKDYRSAINTYELYLKQNPTDPVSVYTARYEVGYLKYKSGRYEEAHDDLTALLHIPTGIPNWIPVLSQEVLDKIKLKLKNKSAKKERKNKKG